MNNSKTRTLLTIGNSARGLRVTCIAHPEWGVWTLGRDRNGWTLKGERGERMLDTDEFNEWALA